MGDDCGASGVTVALEAPEVGEAKCGAVRTTPPPPAAVHHHFVRCNRLGERPHGGSEHCYGGGQRGGAVGRGQGLCRAPEKVGARKAATASAERGRIADAHALVAGAGRRSGAGGR